MMFSRLLKPRFLSILITLLMTMQISACSTNDSATTSANNSGIGTGTDNNRVADVNLSWVAPAEREDNSALSLSEIAGYKIYYGTAQGQYPSNVDINDGSADSYTITSLSTGTYYFVLTTYDTQGRESRYSSEIKKII
jgi:hypothetical protein